MVVLWFSGGTVLTCILVSIKLIYYNLTKEGDFGRVMTSYGYKSSDGDVGGAFAVLLLFGVVMWFFSVIFIPLAIILVIYVVYYVGQDPQQRSAGMLVGLSVVTMIAGVCFFATHDFTSEEAVAQPKIEISSWHYFGGFLRGVGSETWTYSDNVAVKMSDNIRYNYYSGSNKEDTGDYLKISVSEDADKPSKEEIKVLISGGITREGFGNTITLNNEDFPFGETKFTVTASNSAGEVSKTVTVNKVSVAEECARYDKEYGGDFTRLVDSVEEYCKAWKSYTEKKNAPQANGASGTSPSGGAQSSNGANGNGPGASKTCLHYEAGRCWDDLELEAYDQGRYDKTYGTYGQGYYESGDCDSVCQSILEDAYDEGYYDGW